jgi:arylsulfatase A-like enzyme
LRETGELDNTLIMVVSDNGASAEGGPTGTTNEL